MMRKPDKAALRNFLTSRVEETQAKPTTCVIDGGALLHKVKWLPQAIFKNLYDSYLRYVKERYTIYGDICVVFDGYDDDNSIKSHEHIRRTGKTSSNVKIEESMKVPFPQESFLSNTNNKKQFINQFYYKLR